MECFTVNFLQFFTEKHVKIRFLAGRFGTRHQCKHFRNFLEIS